MSVRNIFAKVAVPTGALATVHAQAGQQPRRWLGFLATNNTGSPITLQVALRRADEADANEQNILPVGFSVPANDVLQWLLFDGMGVDLDQVDVIRAAAGGAGLGLQLLGEA